MLTLSSPHHSHHGSPLPSECTKSRLSAFVSFRKRIFRLAHRDHTSVPDLMDYWVSEMFLEPKYYRIPSIFSKLPNRESSNFPLRRTRISRPKAGLFPGVYRGLGGGPGQASSCCSGWLLFGKLARPRFVLVRVDVQNVFFWGVLVLCYWWSSSKVRSLLYVYLERFNRKQSIRWIHSVETQLQKGVVQYTLNPWKKGN